MASSRHGIDAIDLDPLDLWAYGDAEGLGRLMEDSTR